MRSAGKFLAIAALAALVGAPALADCARGQREFRGAISEVSARKLFVESRFDDNIGFERADETRVVGGKSRWEALAKGDVVAICWRFEDRPRRALMITVLK
jgi:hypothetical protein